MYNPRAVYPLSALKSRLHRPLPRQYLQIRNKPNTFQLQAGALQLRLYSSTGYGDDSADSHGKDPMAQGVNQRTRELEHPGPSQQKSSKGSQGKNEAKGKAASGAAKDSEGHEKAKTRAK